MCRGPILTMMLTALLPACATSETSSEKEWARGQCGQVVDREAHQKCLERVGK